MAIKYFHRAIEARNGGFIMAFRTSLFLVGTLAFAAVTGTVCAAVPPEIAAAVADPARPKADREHDASRKPAETVAFAGVKPGDTVVELAPGGGYYTRILAKVVGPSGKVYAVVPAGMAIRPGALDGLNAVAHANSNVLILLTPDFASFISPEKANLVWTTENYHDFANLPGGAKPVDYRVFDTLKPGGIFYVEDHNAKVGAPPEVTRTLHRIDVARARQELLNTGFFIEAESDHLRNPADPGDIPVFDASIRGKTDRFALKLRGGPR